MTRTPIIDRPGGKALLRGPASALRIALFALLWVPAYGNAQNAFTFADQSNVFANRLATSAPVTITGLGTTASVTVAGGSYSIGCVEPFVSTPGTIADGQSVCVRQVAASAAGGASSTTLTVGTVSETFTTTAAASDAVALIAGYYRSILRREADAGGLAFWESESRRLASLAIDVNETWRAMAGAFFGSPEYASFGRSDLAFVTDLYNTFFNRPPDPAGLAFWLDQIAQGNPRESVLLAFLFSAEFSSYTQAIFGSVASRAEVDLVVDFYRGFLARLPDTDGFRYWRDRMREAQCMGSAAVFAQSDAISMQYLGSAEYAIRNRSNGEYLTDLYDGFLRRGSDVAGFTYWKSRLDSGALTREQVRAAFRDSPEFGQRVGRVASQDCLQSLAKLSNIAAVSTSPGPSPFIRFVDLQGVLAEKVTSVQFLIVPKPGSASRPVQVSYSTPYLAARGYVFLNQGLLRVPVFGLYSGYLNTVPITLTFEDNTVRTLSIDIPTGAWIDPAATYDRPAFRVRRAPGTPLDFDFAWIKSGFGSPVVIDTDGEVRWSVPYQGSSFSSLFDGSGFILGAQDGPNFTRLQFDGATRTTAVGAPITFFHHNLEPGKSGYLGEVDVLAGNVENYLNILIEFDAQGQVIKQWDLGAILSDHMASLSDNPALFVRLGSDWFHMNSAIYDPTDDSLVVSSRENFVIKIAYETGNIIWIFGDPTKYWYTFPSLQAKSLALVGGGLYPVGQHALYLLGDNRLQLFNNGIGSVQQPAGAPVGENRTFSAVSTYAIDPVARTARETNRFDYGQTILSNFCSSAYPAGTSTLIAYAFADNGAHARVVGLGAGSNVVFDIQYPSQGCLAAWNAEPIEFHDLQLR